MSEVAVLTDIRSMIDLAIGTPEVGVVDFCMLHTVLHCLAQQLQVLDKPVELHGDAVSTLNVPAVDKDSGSGQTVAIKEYIYETDVSSPQGVSTEKAMSLKPQTRTSDPPSLLVVERVRKDSLPTVLGGKTLERAKPRTEAVGGGRLEESGKKSEHEAGGQIEMEEHTREHGEHEESEHEKSRRISSTEKLSLVTLSKFNVLEDVVHDLKDRVYGSMPKNEQILEEVRSQTNMKAITDMWTNLNVSSRLEAAETGLAKLSSLVEDLIREGAAHAGSGATSTQQAPPAQAPPAQAPPAQAPPAQAPPAQAPPAQGPPAQTPAVQASPDQTSHQVPYEQARPDPLAQFGPPYPWDTMAAEMYEERVALLAQLERLRYDLDQLNQTFYTAMQNMEDGLDPKEAASKIIASTPPPPPPLPPVQITPPPPPTSTISEHYQPSPAATQADERRPGPVTRRSSGATASLMDRLTQLEKRIKECCESIGKDKGVAHDQLNNFQDQLDNVMRNISSLRNDFAALNVSSDLAKDLEGVALLYQSVQDMQNQLEQLNDTVLRLAGERDDRQHHMNALLEQIEILKTIKLDREDMAEAMAEKADLRLLARKVSQDQFEMACDDLSRGLEHALGKLNTQESLWQQVLDDVQREIECKLDKMELSPLRDFFNNKLRQLQENLKQMASLRRDVEAAGTTRRLLRDVNCISCAAEAVMAMENAAAAPSKPMPAHLSMKPYLSYELDAIRKTQASNLPQRNLHDWETIEKQKTPKSPVKVRSEADKHICNRYCGGSHTTTTPAQRVARLGHFVKQWGPDVVPLSSRLAAGDDGKLYKVSSAEHANVGPGGTVDPTSAKKAKPTEPCKPPPKPAAALPPSTAFRPRSLLSGLIKECRCLDGGGV